MRAYLLLGLLAFALPLHAAAPPTPDKAGESSEAPDGQHDFDFEIGTWKTHVSLLAEPLSGSTKWIELDGTSVVRAVANGRANLVELDVAGPSLRIEGVSLRLYEPASRQWTLNYASLRNGKLTPPMTGGFRNGRGEFFGTDTVDGRPVSVRFVITCSDADTCRFEQAFSADGGKTWETNWIAVDKRVKD